MGTVGRETLEPGEEVIFDRRHSLWEIWKNFLIGACAVAALVLLLTKFKPGDAGPGGGTNWGYVALIALLALLSLFRYTLFPLYRQRKLPERKLFLPCLALAFTAAGWGALMWFRNSEGFSRAWTVVAWLAFAAVMVWWLLHPVLKWYFTHFILTDRRLILSWGILSRNFKILPLDQVNDISGSQNIWERIFNYGDLVIESAGEFGQQPFTNIGDPVGVRTLILQQRNKFLEEKGRSAYAYPQASGPTAPGGGPGTPLASVTPSGGKGGGAELELVEGIRELDELRRSGALTEEEFQRAKRELLERLQGED